MFVESEYSIRWHSVRCVQFLFELGRRGKWKLIHFLFFNPLSDPPGAIITRLLARKEDCGRGSIHAGKGGKQTIKKKKKEKKKDQGDATKSETELQHGWAKGVLKLVGTRSQVIYRGREWGMILQRSVKLKARRGSVNRVPLYLIERKKQAIFHQAKWRFSGISGLWIWVD